MSEVLVKREFNQEETSVLKKEYGLTVAQYNLLKNYICPKLTSDELKFAVTLAKRSGMDLLTKELIPMIYISKNGDRNLSMITTIGALRSRAEETGNYAPSNKPPEFETDAAGLPTSCIVWIKKYVKAQWHEIPGVAYFEEIAQKKGDGKLFPNWIKMPRTMLKKCAYVDALRSAFPKAFANIYLQEESHVIQEQETEPATVEPTKEFTEEEEWRQRLFKTMVHKCGGNIKDATQHIKDATGREIDKLNASECEDLIEIVASEIKGQDEDRDETPTEKYVGKLQPVQTSLSDLPKQATGIKPRKGREEQNEATTKNPQAHVNLPLREPGEEG